MAAAAQRSPSAARPQSPVQRTGTASAVRRYELDWLRVGVVVGLIPAHAALIFGAPTALGQMGSGPSPIIFGLVASFVLLWGMPLLFLAAGAGSWFALTRRTGSRYLRERVLRLLVPLAVGVFVLVPLQAYLFLLSNPQLVTAGYIPGGFIHESDLRFLPDFYIAYMRALLAFLTHFSPTTALIFLQHLWFIARLFVYSLVALPLFLALRSPAGRRVIERVAGFIARPGGVLLAGVPLALSEVLLETQWLTRLTASWRWPVYDDWAAFSLSLIFFVAGYLVYADERIVPAILRQGPVTLGAGLMAWAVIVGVGIAGKLPANEFSLGYVLFMLLRGLGTWWTVFGIFHLVLRFLSGPRRVLGFLSEASYPIYLTHFVILTAVAYVVVRWPVFWAVQYAAIVLGATALTFALYVLVLKRVPALRLLLGMRVRAAPDGQG